MAALNSWQKIKRVLPSKPFGRGTLGALVISSNTTQSVPNQSCSGTSGNATLTIAAAGSFTDGDLIVIHQTRGTGVGQWEVNMIASGGGTTTLTLAVNKQYTYTDSGASQAQVFKLPEYTDITVNTGVSWSAPNWAGNVGGVLLFTATGNVGGAGTINLNGANGSVASDNAAGGAGIGYTGGLGRGGNGLQAQAGEGTSGAVVAQSSANGTGGGGGRGPGGGTPNSGAGGGGGGHAASGGNGSVAANGGTAGTGGGTGGSTDLTTMIFGGAGGGGGNNVSEGSGCGGGGAGGGIMIGFGKNIDFSGMTIVRSNGGNGGSGWRNGAGGAGGSLLLAGETVNIGTSKLTVAAGAAGTLGTAAGAGSVGRIAVHYGKSITGSSSPTATTQQDSDWKAPVGGAFLMNFV